MPLRSQRRSRTPAAMFAMALAVVLSSIAPVVAAEQEPTPGEGPAGPSARAFAADTGGLQVVVNERGRISHSIVGIGGSEGDLVVHKPEGAQVRSAYLATATTGFTGSQLTEPVTLGGQPVPITGEIYSGISSYNYFADVTHLVRSQIDAAPAGEVRVSYAEPVPSAVDGSILEVIYDDPAVTTDQSVTILYGALQPTGDTYQVQLAAPVDLGDPATRLEMSLGISYSYQEGGAQQFSTVDVNGSRLTSAAGGEDDGQPYNGGLITVGGEGDSPANPSDPNATPSSPRTDDELYDLRPFVRDGDTRISVTTDNPSLDDNVFLATFTMNPPVTSVSTGDDFVYVALGDSYQSGEGAGINTRPATTYLASAFENGTNYPATFGAQENTYGDGVQGSGVQGNSCHRSLVNYAKINRDRLEPGHNVLLIDRTCSGAQIEPEESGGKPPVVGVQGVIDATSQVQQALDRLQAAGRSPADVDLVTVGMGGNDAGFGKIIEACVGPALLEALLRKYPESPGEISWLSQQATCERVDGWFVKSGDALETLQAKEEAAQRAIHEAFPNARVLQNNYPNILPFNDSPSWCGGLRGGDVEYATQRLVDINDRIRTAAQTTGTELVDSEGTFGPNALCPGGDARHLANGIEQAKFDREVTRLLNLDGNGDPESRRLLDDLVDAYSELKACLGNKLNPFDGDCDLGEARDEVMARAQATMDYLQRNSNVIFGNVVSPPGTTDDSQAVAFDRSRNLFHPNAPGFEVQACSVLNVYQGRPAGDGCAATGSTEPSRGWWPLPVSPGDLLKLVVEYFQARSQVRLVMFSDEVPLGTATADDEGTVEAEVTIPQLNPGVHRLELQGVGADGVQVTQQVLVRVAGRPSGSYTTYLTGFQTRPSTPTPGAPVETVTASLNGTEIGDFQVDEHGGALISVPSIDQLTSNAPMVLTAVSSVTGTAVSENVSPVPTTPSLWALDARGSGVNVLGADFAASGLVHSEAGVTVTGVRAKLTGGVEYATRYTQKGVGISVTPKPRQVSAGQGRPSVPDIADYRPGGRVATSGVPYTVIAANQCVNGVWRPPTTVTGVVYTTCAVEITKAGSYRATFAAEGAVRIVGAGITVGRLSPQTVGEPAIVTGAASAAVTVAAARATFLGQIVAPRGEIVVAAAHATLTCGAVGSSLLISGVSVAAPMDARCLRS